MLDLWLSERRNVRGSYSAEANAKLRSQLRWTLRGGSRILSLLSSQAFYVQPPRLLDPGLLRVCLILQLRVAVGCTVTLISTRAQSTPHVQGGVGSRHQGSAPSSEQQLLAAAPSTATMLHGSPNSAGKFHHFPAIGVPRNPIGTTGSCYAARQAVRCHHGAASAR